MLESLSFNFEELFDGLKAALDLIEVTPEEVVSSYFSNNQEREDDKSIEDLLKSYDDYETSHYTYRKIHGVSPDENIFINGIVVGYSNADSIVIIARDGMIVDIINGTINAAIDNVFTHMRQMRFCDNFTNRNRPNTINISVAKIHITSFVRPN